MVQLAEVKNRELNSRVENRDQMKTEMGILRLDLLFCLLITVFPF